MKKLCILLGIVALVAVLTTVSAANRGIEFIPIGGIDLGGGAGPYSFPVTLTTDGRVIGNYTPFGGCAVWSEMDGWTDLGITSSTCYGSDDGTAIASRVRDEMDFEYSALWAGGTDWEVIPGQAGNASCDYFVHGTFNISGDGSTVGGLTWEGCSYARGYSYTEEGGMVVREGLLDDSSRVNNLNYDGSILVGWTRIPWGGWQATKWVDGMAEWIQDPGEEFDNFLGEAWWVNTNGTVITGSGYNGPPTPNNPFAVPTGWVQYNGGEVVGTDALPGAFFTDQGLKFTSSEDGSIVGGRFGFGPFSSATIWTEATGLINLNQFLIDQGLTEPFDGWFLVQVMDISDDGTKLLVFAADPNGFFGNTSVILDMSKVSVCHAPGGDASKARTLKIGMESMGDHVGHGDFLGTCEAAGGGFARAATAFEHFGVDPNNVEFQQSVESYTANHSAFAPVPPKAMRKMIDAGRPANNRNALDETTRQQPRDRGSRSR